jgi:hypothetical protein
VVAIKTGRATLFKVELMALPAQQTTLFVAYHTTIGSYQVGDSSQHYLVTMLAIITLI